MKKTIKKIVAVATGAAMVGATIFGAAAASLATYPAPFVTNGVADVQFVIGSGATDDYIGVIDIATSLQAESVTEESVATGGNTVSSVEGGAPFGTSNDPLYLGLNLSTAESQFTESDLPLLLADGVLADDDGDEYDYEQKLVFNASPAVVFNKDTTNDIDNPVEFLDIDSGANLWTYTVTFTGDKVNVTALDDSESFDMLGKPFTFDPDSTTSEITLYGSDETILAQLNTPVTIEQDGESYTVEIVGANSDGNSGETVIIDVNGVRKTLTQSQSQTINGLDVYVKDLFVTNIPTLDASANLFIGSQEVVVKGNSEVEINGKSVNGLTSNITTSSGLVSSLSFTFAPEDLNADDVAGYDETHFLLAGEAVSDPMFDSFEVKFAGSSADLKSEGKSYVKLAQDGEALAITFTNDDGDEATVTPYGLDANGNVTYYSLSVDGAGKGWSGTGASGIAKNQVFFLNEASGQTNNTVAYQVTGFDSGSTNTTTIKNLMSGDSKDYSLTDELGQSGITVSAIDTTAKTVGLSGATSAKLFVEGGYHYVTLPAISNTSSGAATVAVTFTENANGVFTSGLDDAMTLTLSKDASDSEMDIDVPAATTDGASFITDDSSDYKHALTKYGTYVLGEVDEDTLVELWVPQDEDAQVSYAVFVAPKDATVVTSGGDGTVTTQRVNRIAIGSAVRDTDVNVANPAKNLIVVGGPCINAVAAELLGLESGACGAASGLSQNEATVQLFTLDNGKVAMLVAGWEATETQAAARAVASGDITSKAGEEATLTVTDARTYTIQ